MVSAVEEPAVVTEVVAPVVESVDDALLVESVDDALVVETVDKALVIDPIDVDVESLDNVPELVFDVDAFDVEVAFQNKLKDNYFRI